MNGASSIATLLGAELAADPSLCVLGPDVGRGGGPFGVTQGLLQQHGPERVLDLPASDRAAAGIALGMALAGRRALVVLDGAGRLGAIAEVLGSAGAFAAHDPVSLVVLVPYGTEAGPLDAPVGFAARIPGISLVCASSPGTVAPLLKAALAAGRPTVVLAPRSALTGRGEPRSGAADKATTLRSGKDLTFAAWGDGVQAALDAADALGEGSADVLDLVALAPIDREAIAASVRKTGRLVVVHPSDAGLALDPAQIGLEGAFEYLESPIRFAAGARDAEAAARASLAW